MISCEVHSWVTTYLESSTNIIKFATMSDAPDLAEMAMIIMPGHLANNESTEAHQQDE
jgi:hypothetical protein